MLVQDGEYYWKSEERKAIVEQPKIFVARGAIEIPWIPKESGYAGPLVLQMVSS